MGTKSIFIFILNIIACVIVFIGGAGVIIFGIIWGFSLLTGELQSPGSVSLSATILYAFLFHKSVKMIDDIAKYIGEKLETR